MPSSDEEIFDPKLTEAAENYVIKKKIFIRDGKKYKVCNRQRLELTDYGSLKPYRYNNMTNKEYNKRRILRFNDTKHCVIVKKI